MQFTANIFYSSLLHLKNSGHDLLNRFPSPLKGYDLRSEGDGAGSHLVCPVQGATRGGGRKAVAPQSPRNTVGATDVAEKRENKQVKLTLTVYFI